MHLLLNNPSSLPERSCAGRAGVPDPVQNYFVGFVEHLYTPRLLDCLDLNNLMGKPAVIVVNP
jgi:hypothetical protein